MNVIEIDDQLSTLTFIGKLELRWNENRIKILNPEVFLTHDFSRHCLWSPSVFFRNQIYAKRQERIQNDLALKIYNRTDQVMSYTVSITNMPHIFFRIECLYDIGFHETSQNVSTFEQILLIFGHNTNQI